MLELFMDHRFFVLTLHVKNKFCLFSTIFAKFRKIRAIFIEILQNLKKFCQFLSVFNQKLQNSSFFNDFWKQYTNYPRNCEKRTNCKMFFKIKWKILFIFSFQMQTFVKKTHLWQFCDRLFTYSASVPKNMILE